MVLHGKNNDPSERWERGRATSAIARYPGPNENFVLVSSLLTPDSWLPHIPQGYQGRSPWLLGIVLVVLGTPAFSFPPAQSSEKATGDLRNQVHIEVHVHVSKITFSATATDKQMNLEAFAREIEGLNNLPVEGWLEEVKEQTRVFWQTYGFFKADVSAESKLQSRSHGDQVFSVKATVRAGSQYRLKKLEFVGATVLSAAAMEAMMGIKPGVLFNVTQIRKGVETIRAAYFSKGYKQFLIDPNSTVDDSEHSITMKFLIAEGPQGK